ncbi:MAG TPA: M28 family peptidase [Chitinophagaceae bacterium]|nr:M28 family peptidase [Chitinophagaceae bacterium]
MRNLFIVVLCLISIAGWSQKGGKPERYAKTITPADLKRQLYIVAGPAMEGRETATEGQRKAAAYIESEFKRIGLQPGANGKYQQLFPVYQDSITGAQLEVDGKPFALNTDFNVTPNSSYNATLRFSEVVYIPAGVTADSLKAMNLAGKAILLQAANNAQFALLQDKGVAAILLVSPAYPRTTPAPNRNQLLYAFRKSLRPQQFTVSPAVAGAILKTNLDSATQLTSAKTFKADVLLELKKETKTLQSSNVVGVLPGTDLKDEYLFITAHYDHLGKRDSVIHYGADDDGSGTVSVIELAETFAQAKKKGNGPRRTLVFMTVSGEEKGLWGSEYYSDHALFPLDKTTADLNIDMIGRSDSSRKGDTTNYVYVVGDDKISSELKPISESANNKFIKLELDYKFNDPADRNMIYYRSDHYNFAKAGVPIIFYYDGMLGSDYHRPTDTPDKINYALMARRAQLVFYTAWEMANRPQLLKRDIALPQLRR